jgi:hypothetical protein
MNKSMNIIREAYARSIQIAVEVGTRSSKRTDCLHKGIGDAIAHMRPELSYKIEKVFPVRTGGTYAVDVTVYKENNPVLFILVKAPLCNIKQNETNNQNSCMGEILKLDTSYQVPIVMFDFMPLSCPYYTKTGEIRNTETFSPALIREKTSRFVEGVSSRLPMFRDRFVVFVNLDQQSKKNVVFTDFEDSGDIDRFMQYLRTI